METTIRLHSLGYNDVKTYWTASLFVLGNIVLPQLFHLLPQGGITWLPIYFFTLIGAYKYGWKVGFLTAVFSPVVNASIFGMPAVTMLPTIMLKSVVLALAAGYAAHRYRRVSLMILIWVVFAYQLLGTLGEWMLIGDFALAVQDFRIGMPGMALQVFGGYGLLRSLTYK